MIIIQEQVIHYFKAKLHISHSENLFILTRGIFPSLGKSQSILLCWCFLQLFFDLSSNQIDEVVQNIITSQYYASLCTVGDQGLKMWRKHMATAYSTWNPYLSYRLGVASITSLFLFFCVCFCTEWKWK